MSRIYTETFDDGPGGWVADLRSPLPVWDGVAHCFSPWSVDANHAPPGAGYLHLLMYLITHTSSLSPTDAEQHGRNRFVENGYSTNLTNAKLTVRLRGTMDLAGPLCNYHTPVPQPDLGGSRLLILVQARIDGPPRTTANFVLTGQPLEITPEWSQQTVHLDPDPGQWTCLGARHDMTDVYGYGDIAEVLRDVNVDIIFILYPLTIVPIGEVGDIHGQWAAKDYKVDMQHLPKGLVMFDTVQIEYTA
ncbi:MAG: hypothetical protein HOC74_06450 [Gemmatimonadetes bacterium]|nr:hypothetical protein [Gemmatimonadota bacterium]